jgi:hypothetical protein
MLPGLREGGIEQVAGFFIGDSIFCSWFNLSALVMPNPGLFHGKGPQGCRFNQRVWEPLWDHCIKESYGNLSTLGIFVFSIWINGHGPRCFVVTTIGKNVSYTLDQAVEAIAFLLLLGAKTKKNGNLKGLRVAIELLWLTA